jgi:hypothetical protein
MHSASSSVPEEMMVHLVRLDHRDLKGTRVPKETQVHPDYKDHLDPAGLKEVSDHKV